MVATIKMNDIARQKPLETDLETSGLTGRSTVGQAVGLYRKTMRLPGDELPWSAYSRGRRLDSKQLLEDLPAEDDEWTVMPEVSAG